MREWHRIPNANGGGRLSSVPAKGASHLYLVTNCNFGAVTVGFGRRGWAQRSVLDAQHRQPIAIATVPAVSGKVLPFLSMRSFGSMRILCRLSVRERIPRTELSIKIAHSLSSQQTGYLPFVRWPDVPENHLHRLVAGDRRDLDVAQVRTLEQTARCFVP